MTSKAPYPHGDDRLLARIDAHPSILNGRPFIRGSRLSVEEMLGRLANSEIPGVSLEHVGSFDADDVRACIEYARRVLAHERLVALDSIAGLADVERIGERLTLDGELVLEERLDDILGRIARHSRIVDADADLDELDKYQGELARAAFQWSVQLPRRLWQLVREFDNASDPDVRTEAFSKIRSGTFLCQ